MAALAMAERLGELVGSDRVVEGLGQPKKWNVERTVKLMAMAAAEVVDGGDSATALSSGGALGLRWIQRESS